MYWGVAGRDADTRQALESPMTRVSGARTPCEVQSRRYVPSCSRRDACGVGDPGWYRDTFFGLKDRGKSSFVVGAAKKGRLRVPL